MTRIAILLLAAAQGAAADDALVVEWDVRRIGRDPLQQTREIRRRERVTLLPDRMRVDDLTFGTVWIYRADRKIVWVVDPLRGRLAELPFESVLRRQEEIATELSDAATRVPGTQDERDIRGILSGMGRYAVPPKVELRETGKTATVIGRECRERSLVVDGDLHLVTVWVDPSFPEGAAFFGHLASIGAFHPTVAEALRGIGGMPLRGVVRCLSFAERLTVEIEAVSVGRSAADPALFEPPADLPREPLEGFEVVPERRVEKPTSLQSGFREDEIDRSQRNPEDEEKKDEKP